jgi:integrase
VYFVSKGKIYMPKQRTGGIKQFEDGTFQVRVSYVGTDGKRHERLRKNITTKTEARKVLKEFLEGLEERGSKAVEGDKLTFRKLAQIYEENHVFAAQYVQNRKVAGLRSVAPIKTYMKVLTENFGNLLVKEIIKTDIQKFKMKRLTTPTVRGSQRSITAVNRELQLLRKMLNFAIENRWLKENPFFKTNLISTSDEVQRDRVLSFQEEKRLLEACKDVRAHLRPLIITALDTACRLGELLKLRWQDIDFDNETITIVAFNTKTAEAREVGMTPRVKDELQKLWESSPKDMELLVFGITNTIKRAWKTACREAKIEELNFHDLRHTAITRLVATGLPSAEIMRISGHKQAKTFLRYVNPKADTLRRAASMLSAFNQSQSEIMIESIEGIQ